ncbi:hypothetical protein [Actinomadura roseirufa]|uniref:hypothetical protein n=1 Tax=Actinomadura roseirufa TaxID=2094049 RepID=UPI001040E2C3|nr:hypothetical protein [Actinomadura roseirufa]
MTKTLTRLGRTALAAGAVSVLLTGMATAGTRPASGTFSYVSPESGDLEINNPQTGECYLLLQGAASAVNGTDTTATIFNDRDCEEGQGTMRPGESRTFGEPLPHSVKFG